MEMKQKLELRKLLSLQLQQSLNILSLHLLDLNCMIEEELLTNPVLEESQGKTELREGLPEHSLDDSSLPADLKEWDSLPAKPPAKNKSDLDLISSQMATSTSLQDVLLRQLGMFVTADEDLRIGQEIIGNIDENGYLRATLEEISASLHIEKKKVEKVLALVQQFEPAGVAARTVPECLLIQLDMLNEKDPLLREVIAHHLRDVAKKNYNAIAKSLKIPHEAIEPLIKKILKLNPKPGLNYTLQIVHRIIPDIIIEEKKGNLEITINNDYTPTLRINKVYRDMLKKGNLDQKTKEFIAGKLRRALELIRAVSKRESTLRRVIETIAEIQGDAIKEDLSGIKPLTFRCVAEKLSLHESTICRVVMNKYVKTPCGVIALKQFFSSHINNQDGQSISSIQIKSLIKELIDAEDKKDPLSDQDIVYALLKEHKLKLARRTVTKYREELKILSSTFRRHR